MTRIGPLDIPFEPSGAPNYAALERRAVALDRFGVEISVASAEDLIAMKRAAGREKDAAHVTALTDYLEQRSASGEDEAQA